MKIIFSLLLGFILLGLLYFAFLFVAHDFNIHFLAIDACLDAGRSWDYVRQVCN